MNQSCSNTNANASADDCKEMKIADGMCLQCPKRKKHDDDNGNDLLTPVVLGLAAASLVSGDKKAPQEKPAAPEANVLQEGTSELESLVDSVCDFGE